MNMIMGVKYREDEKGTKFPFVEVGSEQHSRPSFRLWVSPRLITRSKDGEAVLAFPVRGARIERTGKGSLVLRPCHGSTVHNIYVPCGYRGDSGIEILDPPVGEQDMFPYRKFESPRGNLGISNGMLINLPSGQIVKYRWERTGRLYGASPEGITIVMPDGTSKTFEFMPDGLEAMQELEEEVRP